MAVGPERWIRYWYSLKAAVVRLTRLLLLPRPQQLSVAAKQPLFYSRSAARRLVEEEEEEKEEGPPLWTRSWPLRLWRSRT